MGLTSVGRWLLAAQDGGARGRPAGSSPKANARTRLCPHFRLRPGAPHHRTGRARGSQTCGRRRDTYTGENPQGPRDTKGPVGALSPVRGFSTTGVHKQLRKRWFLLHRGKRALGLQAELRAEDAGRGFAPRAPPHSIPGPGIPRQDPRPCTSVHILTGHQPERWETSLFLQKGGKKPR